MELIPRWEANRFLGSQEIPHIYGTWRFITEFTRPHQLSLSWATSIQSNPRHPTSRSSILILSLHLRHSLPSGLFTSGFPIKTLYAPPLSPIHATCPTYLIIFIT